MVEDYQRLTGDAMAKKDTKALDKITKAYHPFILQLARLPGKNDPMTMTKADMTPAAPGPPPSSVSGVMMPDKLLGGAGQVVLPKGYKLR
jgi:hypothetical protein